MSDPIDRLLDATTESGKSIIKNREIFILPTFQKPSNIEILNKNKLPNHFYQFLNNQDLPIFWFMANLALVRHLWSKKSSPKFKRG